MSRETLADKTRRAAQIVKILKKTYPGAHCTLDFSNPLELLVATILAAQCTDQRVNIVTSDLFRKYRTAKDYADANQEQLEQEIRTSGFYHNKAKALRGMGAMLMADFGGKVPDEMDDLLKLPGVARKTANVVLGNAFGKNEGVVVDTHVTRLAGRLKLAESDTAGKIEQELMQVIPRDEWTDFSHLLVFHGRAICTARKPKCDQCPINKLCPSAFKIK